MDYFTTFKMVLEESGRQKLYTLEPCSKDIRMDITEELAIKESGEDNRSIVDDGQSQKLTSTEIESLKDNGKTSAEIVSEIVGNSQSFASKTEFSQEKYLRKKEKKYFEYIQIRRPTLRLIADIYYRQDPEKIQGIRMDTLSQILSYSNVSNSRDLLLYESGTNGLLFAALLSRMGTGGEGKLLYLHPGNIAQKQAFSALNFPEEFNQKFVAVNVYSVLRCFHQQGNEKEEILEPEEKKIKLDTDTNGTADTRKSWEIDNEEGCRLMKKKLNSLVIVAREHPLNILRNLLPFITPGSPVVIYSQSREVLTDCYIEIKSNSNYNLTALRLFENFMRVYQVLPDRTHPDVNMSGNGGFILTGFTVKS